MGSVLCTALFCGYPERESDGPVCCNKCSGGYDVEARGIRIYLFEIGECSGYDCNWHCEPFGRNPKRKYRFVGYNEYKSATERRSAFAVSKFKVEKVCAMGLEEAGPSAGGEPVSTDAASSGRRTEEDLNSNHPE